MTFALSPHGEHTFRHLSAKTPLNHPTHRDCPHCGRTELRGCFRNGRCRPCRKAQP